MHSTSSTNGAGDGKGSGQAELIDTRLDPVSDARSNTYRATIAAKKLGLIGEVEGTGLPEKLTLAVPGFFFATVLALGDLLAVAVMNQPTTESWSNTARYTLWGILVLAGMMSVTAIITPIVLVVANRRERRLPPDNTNDPARLIIRTERVGYGRYNPKTGTYTVVTVPGPRRPRRKNTKTERARASRWRR